MNGAATAAALLLAVLGFALAFMPRRTALWRAALAAGIALVAAAAPPVPPAAAFAGVWASLIVAAVWVYWPQRAGGTPGLGWVLAVFAGFWAGLSAGQDGGVLAGAQVLPALLAGAPAAWCIGRGWDIAPRVVTSWLLAVALLAGALPFLVEHPGYVADHSS